MVNLGNVFLCMVIQFSGTGRTITLDHCPLMLITNPTNKTSTFFKYEAFWEDHKECHTVINRGWNKEITREKLQGGAKEMEQNHL
ncbi:hypothetical protein Ahy_A05g025597 [Arachis hypogaea]|uniref:Uncharacterized protein n=1 Tax=Arachis hypogaea TaxID=3818 RepID=A0A445D938_ARAHY|nr:hypothetical protein Ahy_A05g025597 [Arachis hypogaea]